MGVAAAMGVLVPVGLLVQPAHGLEPLVIGMLVVGSCCPPWSPRRSRPLPAGYGIAR